MNESSTCLLRDGRRYAWAEYGTPDGVPLLFLHGTPGGRLGVAHQHERHLRLGLRVIAPDRPGYGGSDPLPGRTVRDGADDLVDLLDACAVERVLVVGGSSGGPHALALAAAVPARVRGVGVLVGAAPLSPAEMGQQVGLNQTILSMLDRPEELRPTLEEVRTALLERGVAGLLPDASESDREEWTRNAEALARTLADALAPGVQGMADDYTAVFGTSWGFDVGQVRAPVVWAHGRDDHNVPLAAAERLVDQLPNGRLITWTEVGHAPNTELLTEFYAAVLAVGCRM